MPAGSDAGFDCNLDLLGTEGATGGFKVERFVDDAGHECAFYDTALVFPTNAPVRRRGDAGDRGARHDRSARSPVRTTTADLAAMQTPHESLLVNARSAGLLAAVTGNPGTYPGVVDIYSVKADCRKPELLSSTLTGFFGHESGFTEDGNTFWATSLFTGTHHGDRRHRPAQCR